MLLYYKIKILFSTEKSKEKAHHSDNPNDILKQCYIYDLEIQKGTQ